MKNKLFLGLVVLLALPVVLALFKPGFFVSDDGDWMVIRLTDFHRSVVSGQIPVRWAARLNYGYGYPVFNFSYPLSLYAGEGFHLLGFSFVDSIKLVFVFSFFSAAILMYFLGRELWGEREGLLAAVFYTYAPYRLFDTYVRGSLGEAMSFVFLPLIFWMIVKLNKKQQWRYVGFGALAYAGLIVAHNLMALIFTPIIFGYTLFLIFTSLKSKKLLMIHDLLLILLGFGLASFFWLPALYDKQFTVLSQFSVTNFQDHFLTFKSLLSQAGLVHFLAVFLAAFLIKARKQINFFLLIFFTSLFLVLPFSLFVWQLMPLLWWVQFPWRFLGVAAFCSAVLAGSLSRYQRLAIFLLILVILSNFRQAKPQALVNQPESFYSTNEATTTIGDEYMPIWVKEKPIQRADQRVEVIDGQGLIENLASNSKKINFNFQVETKAKIQINTIYFPGWEVLVDNQPTEIDYQNQQGLIVFEVPAGQHQITVQFKETPLRLSADIISLVSLLVAAALLLKK